MIKVIFVKLLSTSIQLLDRIFPKNQNLLVFGSPTFTSNPYYFYNYIKKYHSREYIAVWLSRNKNEITKINETYGRDSSYNLISFRGILTFLRAKIAVISHGTSEFLNYLGQNRNKKFVVFLFHSIPLKHMGGLTQNTGTFWDLFISSSSIEKRLWHEECNVTSKIINTGMPRNEYLYQAYKNPYEVDRIKKSLDKHVKFSPKYIILYAPTYRHHASTEIFPFFDFDVEGLVEFCRENNILYLIRLHPNESGTLVGDKMKLLFESGYFIDGGRTNFPEIQELLVVTDILITDYSGSYVDFLITKRPTIFIPYDQEIYDEKYGFFFDYNSIIQHTKCYSQTQLLELISKIIANPKYLIDFWSNELDKYHEYDFTRCSELLLEEIQKTIHD